MGTVIVRERRRVRPVIARPLRAPAGDPTPITQAKVHTRAKSRVSIKTRDLRLSSRECDFPGINMPSTVSVRLSFLLIDSSDVQLQVQHAWQIWIDSCRCRLPAIDQYLLPEHIVPSRQRYAAV